MSGRIVLSAFAIALVTAASAGCTGTPELRAEQTKGLETAIFAGGCFWCVESDFDKVPGVVSTTSGYTGGHTKSPTYEQVTAGGTGHLEAVKIVFDPKKVSYEKLLNVFWRSVDPTDADGQFCDRGKSYTTAVFATSAAQRRSAEASKRKLESSKILKKPIVTPVRMARKFYPAEARHQNYHKRRPVRYRFYRFGCGRDDRLRTLWGDKAHGGIPHG